MDDFQVHTGRVQGATYTKDRSINEKLVKRQQREIDELKRERIDLLRQIKTLLECVEAKENEKAEMLAFCKESNDKSADCLREVGKLRRQLEKQRQRVKMLQQRQQQHQQPSSSSTPTASQSTQTEPMPLPLMKLSFGNISAADSCASGLDLTPGSAAWVAERFLPSLGLRQFSSAFQSAGIDLARLLAADKRQLVKLDQQLMLGLTRRRHRRSLLLGVELLRRLRCDWDSLERLRSRSWAAVPLLYWSNANLAQWLASSVGCSTKAGVTDDTSGLHGALLVWSSDWQHLIAEAVKHQQQQQPAPHHPLQAQYQQQPQQHAASATVAALADMDRLVRESLAMRPDEIEDCVLAATSVVSGGSSRLPMTTAPADCVGPTSSGDDEAEHLVDLSSVTLTEIGASEQKKQPPVMLRRWNNNNNNNSNNNNDCHGNGANASAPTAGNGRLSMGGRVTSPVRLSAYRDTMI